MQEDKIEKVSNALAAAWRDGGIVNISEDLWPTSLEESLTIQDAVHAKINEEVGAWKAGMPPGYYGRYYKSVTQKSPGHFRMSDFRNHPQIEGEVALRLGQDLPSRDTPYSKEEIEAAIETVVMTIDMCDTRWYCDPSYWPPSGSDIVKAAADFANAGAIVIGDEIPGWRDIDLAEFPVAIYYDGNLVASRIQGQPFSQMVAGLHWAANFLSQRGFGFQKGLTITTGSIAHAPAEPGALTTVRYGEEGEYGEIQITIT